MAITNETFLITDDDLIKLQERLKTLNAFFIKFALIMVFIAAPILPLYRGPYGRIIDDMAKLNDNYHEPGYNLNWYLHKLVFSISITILLLIFLYYNLIIKIKKDIQIGTKFRTGSTIKKDDKKENISEKQKLAAIEFASEEDAPKLNLWYFIKKNIINKNTKVFIPTEVYNTLEDNEPVIIEYSTYSKTFLAIKKIG